jgi:hypothetical protein
MVINSSTTSVCCLLFMLIGDCGELKIAIIEPAPRPLVPFFCPKLLFYRDLRFFLFFSDLLL